MNDRVPTVWFTGLSGAGKTTLSRAVFATLVARGLTVEILDGDIVRKLLGSDLGYNRADKEENIRRLICLAELLSDSGIMVMVAAISPYRRARQAARQKLGAFLEVHVHASLLVCENRDPKGLYAMARRGEIMNLTGVHELYEEPENPDVKCDTGLESIATCHDRVIAAIDSAFSITRLVLRDFRAPASAGITVTDSKNRRCSAVDALVSMHGLDEVRRRLQGGVSADE